jgi:hypothetical protein
MLDTLSCIGEKLNAANIAWGVGGSILLSQVGLVANPNDIDLLVDIKDVEKLDQVLKTIGEKKPPKKTGSYSTRYFNQYFIKGVNVDVMAGFRINHTSGVYEYTFDQHSISEIKEINEVSIPFTSLEDWYVIYQLIPGRDEKVRLIENYLLKKGIEKPLLLNRALAGSLPVEVRTRIKSMLNY